MRVAYAGVHVIARQGQLHLGRIIPIVAKA
jgi:hypothetical protein